MLKKIERAATTAWSPANEIEPLLAIGTASGALDASFSAKTELEIFAPLAENGRNMKKIGGIQSNARFNRIAWGPLIACGKENGELDLIDSKKLIANAKSIVFNIRKHSGPVRGLGFNSIEKNLLATGATDGEILIWDLNSLDKPYEPGAKSQRLEDISTLAWNKQVPHILSTGSINGYTVVWDLRNRRELISIPYPGGRKPVTSIAWNPDNPTQMLTCNDDDANPVILMWDLRNASAPEASFSGHSKGILCMDWCPKDSSLLLSGGKDNRTLVWDTKSGIPIGDLAHSSNWTFDTKWCPRNPDLVVVASFDGLVSLHSIQGSNSQQDDVFSPQTASANEPSFVDPNDPFSQIGVQHVAPKKSQPTFKLIRPPKWLRRSVGGVWGYGNKLISFKETSTFIDIKSIPTNEEISFRSEQLEYILKENNPDISAQYCDYLANSEFALSDFEREYWNFMKGIFSPALREDMSQFLHYDPNFSNDDKLTHLIKKLNIKPLIGNETNGHTEMPHELIPFSLYSSKPSEETDIDKIVTKSIIAGDFNGATSALIGAGRWADALLVAMNGGQELLQLTQNEYLKNSFSQKPYIRILKSIVDQDLTDIILGAKLDSSDSWRDIIGLICTYSKPEDFNAYFNLLAEKLNEIEFKDQKIKQHALSLCHVGSHDFQKLVQNLCKKEISMENEYELQNLAEKLSLFAQAIGFEDPELALDHVSDEPSPLNNMYEVYVNYAFIASNQGKMETAWRFLEKVPIHFIPKSKIDIVNLRNQVYTTCSKVVGLTGMPPVFPFNTIDVLDYEAIQKAERLAKERELQQQQYQQQQQQQQFAYQNKSANQYQNQSPYSNNYQTSNPGWQNANQNPNWNGQPQTSWQQQPSSNQWQNQSTFNQPAPSFPPTNSYVTPNQINQVTPVYNPMSNIPNNNLAPTPNSSANGYNTQNLQYQNPMPPSISRRESQIQGAPDRSQITNPADKACYEHICRLLNKVKSIPTFDKKDLEEKKLDILFDQMNLHKISPAIIQELQTICNGKQPINFSIG